jgi:hypothetical protein
MESPACDWAWPPWDRLRELIAGGLRFERTPRPGEGERSEPDQPGIARAPGLAMIAATFVIWGRLANVFIYFQF